MNQKQQLYTAICGYDPELPYTSALCDGFYDAETHADQLQLLGDYAEHGLNLSLTAAELECVHTALLTETFGSHDQYIIYDSLSD